MCSLNLKDMEIQFYQFWFEKPNNPKIFYKRVSAVTRVLAKDKLRKTYGENIKINLIKE